ncbi:MAG: CHASE sensor domain-containing protein [Verrucomicrobiia bacterium]
MRIFQTLSIQRKQTLVIMLTSTVALVLACAGFVAYEVIAFRQTMTQNLTTLAQIIGDNSSGALDFNDPKAAQEILSALRAEPNITAACIYTKDGQRFATYRRADVLTDFSPLKMETDGHQFANGHLILCRHIMQKGDTVGSVYLQSDLRDLSVRLRKYISIVGIVLFTSTLAAFLLSSKLQRWLSGPILHLAKTARAVALEKNYALRAVKQSQDELGMLTDDFNEMLTQIQQQDAALQAANESLEIRVERRTRELESSLSLLHATIESTVDGILVVDRQGRAVTYNRKFVSMWRIPEAVLASGDSEQMMATVLDQLSDPEGYLRRVRERQADSDGEGFDLLSFKDGRVFEQCIQPQYIRDEIVGRVWSFRDITERKRAEAKLENLHRQLLDTSRQAGMAEVATNVLHNVGNVLNSVNVSFALVSDRVRKSKLSNLAKAAGLLQEHKDDLAAFLNGDPKGMQLPGYLVNLAQHLTEEQAEVLKELQSLNGNVEHIKEIVAMQQNYSRVSGVVESLPVTELVEDALRMHAAALERHDVQVIREYADTPPVVVDKHKVLQILVNLIRNAKYALDEGDQRDNLLTLRVTKNSSDFVHVSVIDNGVGISPENLTRIFQHGFTTRKDGHGFGLHSGALAAKELGGTLTVHSDGVGKGATFTLTLPCAPKEETR